MILYWAAVVCFVVELARPFSRRPLAPRFSFLVLGLLLWLLWVRFGGEAGL